MPDLLLGKQIYDAIAALILEYEKHQIHCQESNSMMLWLPEFYNTKDARSIVRKATP